jgi:hypothetical protein
MTGYDGLDVSVVVSVRDGTGREDALDLFPA